MRRLWGPGQMPVAMSSSTGSPLIYYWMHALIYFHILGTKQETNHQILGCQTKINFKKKTITKKKINLMLTSHIVKHTIQILYGCE